MKHTNKPEVRDIVLNKFNKRCAYCGCKLTASSLRIDHIDPVCRGRYQQKNYSVNQLNNYNPSCECCNSSKGSYTLEQWRERISKTVDRLFNDGSLLIAKKLKLIKKVDKPVIFYFEKQAA